MQTQPIIIFQGITPDELIAKFQQAFPQQTHGDKVMDVDGTAKFCLCSPSTIRRKINNNSIPYKKINGRIVFLRSKIISWLATNAAQGPTNTNKKKSPGTTPETFEMKQKNSITRGKDTQLR